MCTLAALEEAEEERELKEPCWGLKGQGLSNVCSRVSRRKGAKNDADTRRNGERVVSGSVKEKRRTFFRRSKGGSSSHLIWTGKKVGKKGKSSIFPRERRRRERRVTG